MAVVSCRHYDDLFCGNAHHGDVQFFLPNPQYLAGNVLRFNYADDFPVAGSILFHV